MLCFHPSFPHQLQHPAHGSTVPLPQQLLLLVLVAAVVDVATANKPPVIPAGDTIPEICSVCECLDTMPFDVDCTSMELREVSEGLQGPYRLE